MLKPNYCNTLNLWLRLQIYLYIIYKYFHMLQFCSLRLERTNYLAKTNENLEACTTAVIILYEISKVSRVLQLTSDVVIKRKTKLIASVQKWV